MRLCLVLAIIASVMSCDAFLDGTRAADGMPVGSDWHGAIVRGDAWQDNVEADIKYNRERLDELRRLLEESQSCAEQCPPGCWCQPLPDVDVRTW